MKSKFSLAMVNKSTISAACLAVAAAFSVSAEAAEQFVESTIATVAVNGGADAPNQGTTCVQVSSPVSAACTGGYIAIPNNNKQLIAAALLNKSLGGKVLVYYHDANGNYHCPGFSFTSCAVSSIQSR